MHLILERVFLRAGKVSKSRRNIYPWSVKPSKNVHFWMEISIVPNLLIMWNRKKSALLKKLVSDSVSIIFILMGSKVIVNFEREFFKSINISKIIITYSIFFRISSVLSTRYKIAKFFNPTIENQNGAPAIIFFPSFYLSEIAIFHKKNCRFVQTTHLFVSIRLSAKSVKTEIRC